MKRNKGNKGNISEQMKNYVKKEEPEPELSEGNFNKGVVSTGSTLLDLAISGEVVRGGGIPGGIVAEIFGPSGIGKTSMLCEVAGSTRRQGGEIQFKDPESRLKKEFAAIFDLEIDDEDIDKPDTPTQVFKPIRSWEPGSSDLIHGVFLDSSAALVSDTELEDKTDEYSRRAKLFSQELRKTCRYIERKNLLVFSSNQLRQKVSNTGYGEQFEVPGGEAFKFYSSLRLRAKKPPQNHKLTKTIRYQGKDITEVIGVKNEIEVYKSTVGKPFRSAPVYVVFNYGIDDIRANLQWLKTRLGTDSYTIDGKEKVGGNKGLDGAVAEVEENDLEDILRETVIDIWEEIEKEFRVPRKPKKRG